MTAYKQGRWVAEILALQQEDGLWGNFHTLSAPTPKQPLTTEQALRRLQILGFSQEDEPVARGLSALHSCLAGKREMPNRRETHNWDIFTELMLAVWIRRFTPDDELANAAAKKWAGIVTQAFAGGEYDQEAYAAAYRRTFGMKPRGGRLVDFVSFYPISLLAGEIPEHIQRAYFEYILDHETGIYYIYPHTLLRLPQTFQSKQASRYLAAVELLCRYPNACVRERLAFVAA